MYAPMNAARKVSFPQYETLEEDRYYNRIAACDWPSLRNQLLAQWSRLSKAQIDKVGPNRHKIAMLVENQYGISAPLVENYLSNLERTLPVL
jgi:hypothetical protein